MHQSSIDRLAWGAICIKRLADIGYGNSRVTSLTTVAGLLADIVTFRDTPTLSKMADRATCDAAIDAINWAASLATPIIDGTIVTSLTTVNDETVSATTDLGYVFRGNANVPTWYTTGDNWALIPAPNQATVA